MLYNAPKETLAWRIEVKAWNEKMLYDSTIQTIYSARHEGIFFLHVRIHLFKNHWAFLKGHVAG